MPWSIVLGQCLAIILIAIGLWFRISGRPKAGLPMPESILILSLLMLVFLSAVFSGYFKAATPQFNKSWILLLFSPLIWFSQYYSPKKVINALIWGTALASAIGAYRYFTGSVLRATPFSGGYTTLALFDVAALPLAITHFSDKASKYRWFYILAILIICLGLIGSESRAGWIAALVGVIVVGFKLRKKLVTVVILSVAALVIILPGGRHMLRDRFQIDRPGGITSGRTVIWANAREPLSHLPLFGYGPESFKRLFSPIVLQGVGDPKVNSWHCTPLDLTIESGPLALLVVLALAVVTIRRSWRTYYRADDRPLIQLAIFASLLALYLAALSTNIFRDFMLSALTVCLWALIFAREPKTPASIA